MIILFSNGVLELCAAMLRKLDRQNRAQNVQEQSLFLRMLKLIEQNDAKGEQCSYTGLNLQ